MLTSQYEWRSDVIVNGFPIVTGISTSTELSELNDFQLKWLTLEIQLVSNSDFVRHHQYCKRNEPLVVYGHPIEVTDVMVVDVWSKCNWYFANYQAKTFPLNVNVTNKQNFENLVPVFDVDWFSQRYWLMSNFSVIFGFSVSQMYLYRPILLEFRILAKVSICWLYLSTPI